MYKELNTIITIIAPFLLVFSSYNPLCDQDCLLDQTLAKLSSGPFLHEASSLPVKI